MRTRFWKLDEVERGKREIFHFLRAVSEHVGHQEGEFQKIVFVLDERRDPLVVGSAAYAGAVAVILFEEHGSRILVPQYVATSPNWRSFDQFCSVKC